MKRCFFTIIISVFIFLSVEPKIYAWPIPDTGVTTCFDNTTVIPCPQLGEPFYGQDGNYTINPPSYTKLDANGNALPNDVISWSMVRDNVTGFIWEMKTNKDGFPNYDDPHDADNKYTWCDTNPTTNGANQGTCDGFDTKEYIEALNTSNYGGFSDWRMPTMHEILSLADFSRVNPVISLNYFPNVYGAIYWSSNTSTTNSSEGLAVNLWIFDVDQYDKSMAYYTVAVRGVSNTALLFDNKDGTVTDTQTSLLWQKESSNNAMPWESAISYCENLDLGMFTDWRVPNIKELESIVDYTQSQPSINSFYFPNTPPSYFFSSTTTGAYSDSDLYHVNFGDNTIRRSYKSEMGYVRCVRGGQSRIRGDIHGDGSVDLKDAILSLQVLSGLNPLGISFSYVSSNVDVNNDGKIGLEETAYILQIIAGLRAETSLSVLNSITVIPTNQSIAKGYKQQFTATGTYSGNTTQDLTTSVSWGSSDTNIATVSNADGTKGQATSIAVGSTTVTAISGSVSGNATLTVTDAALASISVTPTNQSIAKGYKQQFTATGIFSDSTTQDLTATSTWGSSDTGVAIISNAGGSKGNATAVTVGITTIIATSGNISGTTIFTVTSAVLISMAVTPTNPSIVLGTTKQFAVTGSFSDSTTQDMTTSVTWNSSNTGVATISNVAGSKGLASSIATGSTTITATDAASGIFETTLLTVTPAALASISVTPANTLTAKGTTKQFTATGTFTNSTTQDITASVTWNSSNTGVATISNVAGSKGLASSIATGSTTITATDAASGISGTTLLTVTPAALASISVTPANTITFPVTGTTKQFAATGTYTDSTTQILTASVTWASSNTGVATISNAAGSKGLASSIAIGSTTITATDAASGISGTTLLTVVAWTSFEVIPSNTTSIAKGTTKQFQAMGTYMETPHSGYSFILTAYVTWNSSNTGVATISNVAGSKGLASSIATGSTTITATDAASGISGTTLLTVTPAALASISVTPANPSIVKGTTKQFTATGTFTDNTTQDITASVTWAASNTGVATISNVAKANGLVTSVAVGTTTISAKLGSISNVTTITVTPAPIVSIAITPAGSTKSRATDFPLQMTATGTYSDGSKQNITGQVTWQLPYFNPPLAFISSGISGGVISLVSNLTTNYSLPVRFSVTATLAGLSNTTTVTVTY